MSLIKRIGFAGLAIAMGLVLATAVAAADIPEELVPLAQDLGCQTKEECALKFEANIENGITLAQKYDIYTPEQEKVASTFKTEVLERLRTVNQDNFEEEILTLANKILKEKPALAKTMGVTREGVNNAKTIINSVKDAGVDIRTCQKSPEDLSREQLIACIKAGNDLSNKEKSAGDYIPKENVNAKEAGRMIDLENSLLAGEYGGLGRINAEEAGKICLKPGSESMADCDRIAEKFFGAEGVKHLQEARQETVRIKEYYTEGIKKMELVTPDGQRLIGKDAIKNACNKAFEEHDLEMARACGNFAVKNGYATERETESGLKLLETFSQKAQGVKFDDCRFNPQSCREFLPDESRSQFDSQFEIFKVMSESIGFDPSRCENTYDADIGKRCLEGAKKALTKVEEIAKNSPEARRVVDEIRFHINEGERMTERQNEFNQDSNRGGMAGPGGCRGPEECYKYCSQPANGAECISFGGKSQIFDQNTVVERFNTINEKNEGFDYRSFPNMPDSSPQFRPPEGTDPQFNNQYPSFPPRQPDVDPGFNRYPYPRQPAGPSPECFAAISSGDFARAKTACSSTTENYPKPIAEPFPMCPNIMPSPCGEGQMRQMARDAKGCMTYGACVATENYKPIDTNPKPCAMGTYWDGKSCVTNPEQNPKNICPSMPTVNTCPAGQEKYQTYNSPECGTYYGCRDVMVKTVPTDCPTGMWWNETSKSCSYTAPTIGSCNYSTQYWKPATSQCLPRTNCTDTTNSEYNSQECQGVRGMTQPVPSGCGSMTTQATCQASPGCGWANGACGGNNNTSCPMGQWWNGTTCLNSSATGQCPTGQYWYTPSSGGAGYCMSSTNGNSCPSGYHSHSESGGFCMNDQENYSGTCYNSSGTATITCPQQTTTPVQTVGSCNYSTQYWKPSTSQCMPRSNCTDTTNSEYNSQECQGVRGTASPNTTTCSSGQWWNGTSCVSSTTTTCTSGQYWNGSACVSNSTTGQCPSGQYWYTPSGGGTGYCQSSSAASSDASAGCAQAGGTWNSGSNYCQMPTSNTTCSSGQYWNGSACVAGSTTNPYTTDPSAACAQGGGTWNTSTNYCQMSTSNTTPPPAPTPTPPPPSPEPAPAPAPTPSPSPSSDPATGCAQAGGTWTGTMCQMAEGISEQKAYYSYYQKQSTSLLAQVLRGFVDLFR